MKPFTRFCFIISGEIVQIEANIVNCIAKNDCQRVELISEPEICEFNPNKGRTQVTTL